MSRVLLWLAIGALTGAVAALYWRARRDELLAAIESRGVL